MKDITKEEELWRCNLEGLNWNHWKNYREALPETGLLVTKLGRVRFYQLLEGWVRWPNRREAIKRWREIWFESSKDQRRRLREAAVSQRIFRVREGEEEKLRSILVSIGSETFLSGAFSFWLYCYREPQGVARRYIGTVAVYAKRGEKKNILLETFSFLGSSGDLKGLQNRFLAASWCVWILLLLFSILNSAVIDFFESIMVSNFTNGALWITFLIVGAIGTLFAGSWYFFVEVPAIRELDIDPTAPLLYPGLVFVAGSTLVLAGMERNYFAYAILFLLPLSLLTLWLWKSIALWVRVLACVLVVAFAILLSPLVYVKEVALGWVLLLVGNFACLRLWWLSLDFYDRSQEERTPHRPLSKIQEKTDDDKDDNKNEKGLWKKLLGWVFPDDYKPDQIVLTPVLIVALLLTNLLWFHSQLTPDVRVVESQEPITVVHPPWLSTEDQGAVEVRFINSLLSSQIYTVTVRPSDSPRRLVSSIYSDGIKDGLVIGYAVAEIPGRSQANFHFTVETDPVSFPAGVIDLFREWGYEFEAIIEGEGIPSKTVEFFIPVLSLYLPSLYASASTFQGWFLRSFWAFAQVLAAAFFAARVDRSKRSENSKNFI